MLSVHHLSTHGNELYVRKKLGTKYNTLRTHVYCAGELGYRLWIFWKKPYGELGDRNRIGSRVVPLNARSLTSSSDEVGIICDEEGTTRLYFKRDISLSDLVRSYPVFRRKGHPSKRGFAEEFGVVS